MAYNNNVLHLTNIKFSTLTFDKQKYLEDKQKVIQLIKDTHKWDTTEGFIADGIINPDIYEKQKIKILVLLAESYGYDKCGVTEIEDQAEEDILGVGQHNIQTSKKIPTLLWILFKSIDFEKELSRNEFPNLLKKNDTNYHLLQGALSRIAYVNVKKASKHIENIGNNEKRQDYSEISYNCYRNADILKLRIKSICPDLIIACSNPVYDSLHKLGLWGEKVAQGKKYEVQINEHGQKVIQVNHPSYFKDWGYEGIFKIYQIIFKSLNITN